MRLVLAVCNRWRMVVVAAVVCATWQAPAAIPPDQLAPLTAQVEAELERAITSLVNERQLAAQLFLGYPVKPPTRTKEQVHADVERAVAAAAQAKFAELTPAYYRALAEERYPLYKAYDTVTVTVKDGNSYHDVLRDIGAATIRIGPNVIRYEEMTEQSLLCFKPDLCAIRRQQFVNDKLKSMDQERTLYERALREEIESKYYSDAGYQLVRGEWVPQQQLLQELVRSTKDGYRQRLRPAMTQKIFSEAGYVLYNGEWMKPAQRAKLQAPAEEAPAAPAPVVVTPTDTKEPAKDVATGGWGN